MSERIGPRWLTWIILAYGILEIPWVIYLIFFQVRTGTAMHTHLASLGLNGGGALMALITAWAVLKDARWAPIVAVMTAAWLGAGVFFAFVLSSAHVVWAAMIGIVLAVIATTRSFRGERSKLDPWLSGLLALVAVFLLLNLARVVTETSTTMPADHLRGLVVLYDSAEVASLLGLGLSLRAGAARAAVAFGSAGVVLFFLDAYINVVVVPPGQAFYAALFYAIFGELPSIAMCAAGVLFAFRRWQANSSVRSLPSEVAQA